MTQKLLNDPLGQEIAELVDFCCHNEPVGKQSLMRLYARDRRLFCRAAIRVLACADLSPGARTLVHLLTRESSLTSTLLDVTCSLPEARSAARLVADTGTPLQATLHRELRTALQACSDADNSQRILRLLDLFAAISAQDGLKSFESDLMAFPDKRVRSKAVFLIGRGTKSAAWIGKHLVDSDTRVQANAIQALDAIDAADPKPILQAALKSSSNRVAGNAALGLYRLSDLSSVASLLRMANHEDPRFQLSGLWAIGETQDPRFVPYLKEQFERSEGRKHLAVTRALARIRQREKACEEKPRLDIHIAEAAILPDGRRRVAFTLWCPGAKDLMGIRPTEVALWEGGELIEDYTVRAFPNPALLAAGFIIPRFDSAAKALAAPIVSALQGCLAWKRPGDLWRIDRYSIEAGETPSEVSDDELFFPYDDALRRPSLKTRRAFVETADFLSDAIAWPVPVEKAAPDGFAAIARQCEAIRKHRAERHVFVFLHPSFEHEFNSAEYRRCDWLAREEKIAMHVFVPDGSDDLAQLRSLCAASHGTVTDARGGSLAREVEKIYLRLLNRYEVSYRLPAGAPASEVRLKVSSECGRGDAVFSFAAGPQMNKV